MTRTKPTKAEPGSREKLEILKQRLAAGQPLFHSKDRRIEYTRYNRKADFVSVNALLEAMAERFGQRADAE